MSKIFQDTKVLLFLLSKKKGGRHKKHEAPQGKRQMQGRGLPVLDRRHKCRGEKFFILDRRSGRDQAPQGRVFKAILRI
jgi:hypothetical protein